MDDKIIRVTVHVDTTGREDVPSYEQKFYHDTQYCANEQSALRSMDVMLYGVLDSGCTMRSTEDLISVNAELAEKYDEPYNLNAYASIEDITEETIIKCREAFCEHHWSHDALVKVADELGVDLYEIEKR